MIVKRGDKVGSDTIIGLKGLERISHWYIYNDMYDKIFCLVTPDKSDAQTLYSAMPIMNGIDLFAHCVSGGVIVRNNTRGFYDRKCYYIILSRENDGGNEITFGTIAHECVHAKQYMFEHIGENDSIESEAYLVDWLVNSVLECLGMDRLVDTEKWPVNKKVKRGAKGKA